MKDSNTWQSLIGSVWGLQDLVIVISTNSYVQRHFGSSVHVTTIKASSLPVVRNNTAAAAAAVDNLTQLEHPTVTIFRHGHTVVATLRYSNSSNGLEMSL